MYIIHEKSLCCCLRCDRVAHPHYLYRFSNNIDFVNPVTSWAVSFWIFCSDTYSCAEHPSNTTDAYSTTGNR